MMPLRDFKVKGENTMATKEPANNSETNSLEGKYLTFVLNNEEYGLEILKVREIIGVMDITPSPDPAFVRAS